MSAPGKQQMTDSLQFSILQQMLFIISGGMILDGGGIFQIVMNNAAGYWAGFFLIMARRHNTLTSGDRILIRWGFLMLLPVSSIATQWIWHLKDL